MDALKAAAAGGGAGGADAKQDAQAEDYVYTRTMSEERLKLRTFVRSIWMSGFIYSVIIFNTIVIAADDVYSERTQNSWVQSISIASDWVILVIFTIEMLLKIIGLGAGFRAPDDEEMDPELAGYFASSWNRFDCFIVIMSWILVPMAQFSGADIQRLVRIMRLTRPLRAFRGMRRLQAVQMLLQTLPTAFPAFVDVTNLMLFLLIVFAILCLNLWGLEGKLHGRCVVAPNRTDFAKGLETQGFLQQPAPVLCGKDGFSCDPGFVCSCVPEVLPNGKIETRPYVFTDPLRGDQGCLRQGTMRPWVEGLQTDEPVCPDFGFTCWDSFPLALFTSFKVITLEGWSQTMWYSQATMNPWAAIIVLVFMVILVTFNVVNLYVASISNAYRDVRTKHRVIEQRKNFEKAQMKMSADIEKARIRHEREEAIASGDVEEEEEEEEASPSLLDRIFMLHERLGNHKDSTEPLMPLARWLRRVFVYPLVADECGTIVPHHLIRMMASRNLEVKFGPEYGEWTLFAKKGQEVRRYGHPKVYRDGEKVQVGKAATHVITHANNLLRADLRAAIKEFSISKEREEEDTRAKDEAGPTAMDNTTPLIYSDLIVLIAILVNAVSSAVEHFDGYAVETLPGVETAPWMNCCNEDCSLMDAENCPRGLIKMSTSWRAFIFWVELVFNIFFTAELSCKIVSWWSVERFITESYPGNLLDVVIVAFSDILFILDLFIEGLFSVAIFRLLRLVRAVKMARRLKRLRLIIDKSGSALSTIIYVVLILLLWHMLASLIGMQLFRCPVSPPNACKARTASGECPKFCPIGLERREGEAVDICYLSDEFMFEHCPWTPHRNFNTFRDGMITLFFVTTGDNSWTDIIHSGMRSGDSAIPGAVFFLIFFILSYYTICNLFISVILEVFETPDERKSEMQVVDYRFKTMKKLTRRHKKLEAEGRLDEWDQSFGVKQLEGAADEDLFERHKAMETLMADDDEWELDEPDTAVFCFAPPMPNKLNPLEAPNFRFSLRKVVESRVWSGSMLLVILTSTIFLALDTTIPSLSVVPEQVAQIADYVFFSIFAVELICKILDTGVFLEGPKGYFRQSWNWLDFFLLLFQVLDLLGLKGLRALRVLRVLRPLRLLNKVKSLQLLLTAMGKATTDLINVMMIWALLYLIFAIIGIFLFGGRLHACSDASFVGLPLNLGQPEGSEVGFRENCAGNFVSFGASDGTSYVAASSPTPIMKPRVWSNPGTPPSDVGFSFDNFGIACQTLFEASTLKLWSKYTYAGADVTGVAQHPVTHAATSTVLFFQVWVCVSCFFILQMIIGVLIDSINQETGSALFTQHQRNWIRMEERMRSAKPLIPIPMPTNAVRKNLWFMVNHPFFLNFMTTVIFLNILLMATEHYDQSEDWSAFMATTNVIFLAIYIAEIVLKLVAFHLNFFRDYGNLFDLLVVISSVADEALSAGGGTSGLQALRVLRVLRVLRTLRVVRRSERLLLIINTLTASMSAVMSSLLFLFLFILLLAVIGNQFFSGLKFGSGLNRFNNFDTPWNGFLCVLVIITGDNWQSIMRSTAIEPPYCTTASELEAMILQGFVPNDPTYQGGDCGNTLGAMLFFDIAYLCGFNIIRSLFIAVLMESFFAFKGGAGFMITPYHVEQYRALWRTLDPNATGLISISMLRKLIEILTKGNNPLGLVPNQNEFKYQQLRIELTTDSKQPKDEHGNHQIALTDTLVALGLYCVGPRALKYEASIARVEKVCWYGQLAACSRMVGVFRGIRARREAHEARMGLLQGGVSVDPKKKKPAAHSNNEASAHPPKVTVETARQKKTRESAAGLDTRPVPPEASAAEMALVKVVAQDLDRALLGLGNTERRLADAVPMREPAGVKQSQTPGSFKGKGALKGKPGQGSFKAAASQPKSNFIAGRQGSALSKASEEEAQDPRERLRKMQYKDVLSGAVHAVPLKPEDDSYLGYGNVEDMHVDQWGDEEGDEERDEEGDSD